MFCPLSFSNAGMKEKNSATTASTLGRILATCSKQVCVLPAPLTFVLWECVVLVIEFKKVHFVVTRPKTTGAVLHLKSTRLKKTCA